MLNDIRLHAFLAAVLLIERFFSGLSSEIQYGLGAVFCERKKSASDSLSLIFRQNQQLGNRTEKISVCKDSQCSYKHIVMAGSYVQRL